MTDENAVENVRFLDFFQSLSFDEYKNFHKPTTLSNFSQVNVFFGEKIEDAVSLLDIVEYATLGSCRHDVSVVAGVKTTPDLIRRYGKFLSKYKDKSKIIPEDFTSRKIAYFKLLKQHKTFGNNYSTYNKGVRNVALFIWTNEMQDTFFILAKKYLSLAKL